MIASGGPLAAAAAAAAVDAIGTPGNPRVSTTCSAIDLGVSLRATVTVLLSELLAISGGCPRDPGVIGGGGPVRRYDEPVREDPLTSMSLPSVQHIPSSQ